MRRAAGKKDSKAYKGIADDGLTITGYFDDPQAVMGLTFFHELYQKHKVSAVEGIPDAWVNQKAAFFISPDNAMGTYKRLNATFQYGVDRHPVLQGRRPDAYWMLHAQPRSAWTFELDLRPYKESF